MSTRNVRVRFAPSPTGSMHLGNIRTALMNYLFARQKQGTFILRIEDTDAERNFDPGAQRIQEDLAWLGLTYDEGPGKGGPHTPYYQSERQNLYTEQLNRLIAQDDVYRCFCTHEQLEARRERQIALKLPPRYDRTCLRLSAADVEEKLASKTPFIWRLKLDSTKTLTMRDLGHGTISFEMKNFSDFPLTRADGSYTFMFANFVDDALMQITHVFRGEDHLSNTACQLALYDLLKFDMPIYWHLPIVCNIDGKKLSKRDFGFSLRDLRESGFLPQAIVNYLSIIGTSVPKDKEIASLDELVTYMDFDAMSGKGQPRYDVEKLRWTNHQWITRCTPQELAQLCRPYLEAGFAHATSVSDAELAHLLSIVMSDITTLGDITNVLGFFFEAPQTSRDELAQHVPLTAIETLSQLSRALCNSASSDAQAFTDALKEAAKQQNIPAKQLFEYTRYVLTGSVKGLGLKDIVSILGTQESCKRLQAF